MSFNQSDDSSPKPNTLILTRDVKNVHVLLNRSGVNSNRLDYKKVADEQTLNQDQPTAPYRITNLNSCLKQLNEDGKIYREIVHAILYSIMFAVLVYCYNSLHDQAVFGCLQGKSLIARSEHWYNFKFFKFLTACKSQSFNYNLLIAIAFSNVLTFVLVLFDKYQAFNRGYRVRESLILVCFHAGGFPVGWTLLLQLNHKILSFKFVFLALLATCTSFLWQYLYVIFK